ncbi:MAG: hypothetical protein PVG39_31710 [Desulfobacteraceae bacterium]|jgi:hypothetical protein
MKEDVNNNQETSEEDVKGYEGYEKVETDLVLATLTSVGQHIQGVYEGVEMVKTPEGKAEYLAVNIKGTGIVAIPVNPSLSRATQKLHAGDEVIIELAELVPQKGNKQDFKKYSVFRKKKLTSFDNQDMPE